MKFAILISRKRILSELGIDHIEYPAAQKGIRIQEKFKACREEAEKHIRLNEGRSGDYGNN